MHPLGCLYLTDRAQREWWLLVETYKIIPLQGTEVSCLTLLPGDKETPGVSKSLLSRLAKGIILHTTLAVAVLRKTHGVLSCSVVRIGPTLFLLCMALLCPLDSHIYPVKCVQSSVGFSQVITGVRTWYFLVKLYFRIHFI